MSVRKIKTQYPKSYTILELRKQYKDCRRIVGECPFTKFLSKRIKELQLKEVN